MSFLNVSEIWGVFSVFLRLGLTSFGGPIAHLGYFYDEFVVRRRWIGEKEYADLVALCQFLPGPASSQVGMAMGFFRHGYLGTIAAWTGFTLPSALLLIFFALGLSEYKEAISLDVIHGLKVVAVAIVAQAIWGMAKNLCTDVQRITIMTLVCCAVLLSPSAWVQVAGIILSGLVGRFLFKPTSIISQSTLTVSIGRKAGFIWLGVFAILLLGLPALQLVFHNELLDMINIFYRAGSLVFGGGHVILPLLQSALVPTGFVNNETFLAGYGAAQAVPGPLFTFAAFLGSSIEGDYPTWLNGIICLLSIFIPSFFLVVGALPFWNRLRQNIKMQAALAGINAAVVGILLAALYQPVWTSSITKPTDFILAFVGFIALVFWKISPWVVVAGSAVLGWLIPVIIGG